ncbi:MAG: hypothetical protein AAF499_05690, partial [Pseudomonadota bacterium]
DGGTGGGTGGGSGTITSIGGISVSENVPAGTVTAGGFFFQLSPGVSADLFRSTPTSRNALLPTLNVCNVSVEQIGAPDTDEIPGIDPDANVEITSISAGDPITLTSGGTQFMELNLETFFGLSGYVPNPETVPGPIPQSYVITIPGSAQLPASTHNAQGLAPFALTGPQGPVTPDSVFTWVPGSDPDAYISLRFQRFNADATVTSVHCDVPDTGLFPIPTDTAATMGADFISTSPASGTREKDIVVLDGATATLFNQSSGD